MRKSHRGATSGSVGAPGLRYTSPPQYAELPYQSLRLRPLRDRFPAWREGHKDGTACLPLVIDGQEPSTPYLYERSRQVHEVIERERLLLLADTALLAIRLQEVEGRLRTVTEDLIAAEQELAEFEVPTEEALTNPRDGEKHLNPTVIRQRRVREHERVRYPVHQRIRAARSTLADLHGERAWVHEQISRRVRAAQRRSERFCEFVGRCVARYGRTVVRRHPDGANLASKPWPTRPALPEWVTEPDPLVVIATALIPEGTT